MHLGTIFLFSDLNDGEYQEGSLHEEPFEPLLDS